MNKRELKVREASSARERWSLSPPSEVIVTSWPDVLVSLLLLSQNPVDVVPDSM